MVRSKREPKAIFSKLMRAISRYNLVHTLIKYIYLFQMFPWFGKIMVRLPEWIVTRLAPQARVFSEFHAVCFLLLA